MKNHASLTEALERFKEHDGERLPVVNDVVSKHLIGTVAKTDVILALAGSTTLSATAIESPIT
jgi:CBS domain-containing protein